MVFQFYPKIWAGSNKFKASIFKILDLKILIWLYKLFLQCQCSKIYRLTCKKKNRLICLCVSSQNLNFWTLYQSTEMLLRIACKYLNQETLYKLCKLRHRRVLEKKLRSFQVQRKILLILKLQTLKKINSLSKVLPKKDLMMLWVKSKDRTQPNLQTTWTQKSWKQWLHVSTTSVRCADRIPRW